MIDNLAGDIFQLGKDNADLLVRHDAWLEQERKEAQSRLDRNVSELRNIISAQAIKRRLQQKNLVAVQRLIQDGDGNIIDICVDIMKLPDALEYLNTTEDIVGGMNNCAQLHGLNVDGYDTTLGKDCDASW